MLNMSLILSGLRHYKVGVVLMLIQIALTFSIVCNVTSISGELVGKISRPSGMSVEQNIAIESIAINENFNANNTIEEDLRILRATPGVIDASVMSEIPLGPSAMVPVFATETEKHGQIVIRGYMYVVDEHAIPTLGLELAAGRNFSEQEIVDFQRDNSSSTGSVNSIILTKRWADMLYPDGDALGREILTSYGNLKVIGLLDVMQGAWADWEGFDRVALYPGRVVDERLEYIVRTDEKNRDRLIAELEEKLYSLNDRRIISSVKGQNELLSKQYENHSALLTTLVVINIVLLGFAAFGIYALTKFNVSRQIKQIGIKRALGATKVDVILYYLVESSIIFCAGLILGLFVINLLNSYLVSNYSITTIDWTYVPIILVGYILIGFVAVYFPAAKAAAASPVASMRA